MTFLYSDFLGNKYALFVYVKYVCEILDTLKIKCKYNFYLVIEVPDHVYVLGETYTCHTDLSGKKNK